MFWGLVIKPGKRYETEVQEPFRITKACIEPSTAKDGKVTSVYVEQSDNNEEFIIANLNLKNFNESIDLSFNEGEKICFKIDGPGTVHLTGNLLDDPPPGDMFDMEDSEDDSEDSEAVGDSEEESVEAGNKIQEVSDKEAAKILKRKKNQPAEEVSKKKAKVAENGNRTVDTTLGDLDDTNNFAEEEDSDDDDDDSSEDEGDTTTGSGNADTTAASDDDSDDDDDEEDDEESESEEEEKKPVKTKTKKEETPKKEAKTPKQDASKSAKKEDGKQEAKTPKQEVKTPKDAKTPKDPKTPKDAKTPKDPKTPKDAKTPKDPKTPKEDAKTPAPDTKTPGKTPKRTIKGGISIEDLKEGTGQEVKAGNTVGMFYSGRLQANNKKFDSCLSGPPFKFKLGKGEVIKGWDLGVLGIKVGGKRRLTIPPKLAYGQNGAPPDIPPNSTLVFEIECKFAK